MSTMSAVQDSRCPCRARAASSSPPHLLCPLWRLPLMLTQIEAAFPNIFRATVASAAAAGQHLPLPGLRAASSSSSSPPEVSDAAVQAAWQRLSTSEDDLQLVSVMWDVG